jgi:hypothetical protein
MRATFTFVGAATLIVIAMAAIRAQNAATAADGVITGVVASEKGAEAGVWVIAETTDLKTIFRKIVVTNDEGRFLLPELPAARYSVWVRGYGLADSKPVPATAGQTLKLTANVAKSPQEAARVYPASSWLALMEIPGESDFPGTGAKGNGINPAHTTRESFMFNMKGCLRCHQVGNEFTRTIPEGAIYDSSADAWDKRVVMGQRGGEMSGWMSRFGRERGVRMFADWSDRIAKGEVPPPPPRPQGKERHVVVTSWQWTNEMGKIHDEVSTDKRNPRVNANGPIYGTDIANDNLAILDPKTHTTQLLRIPTLADRNSMTASYAQSGYPASRLGDGKVDRFNPTSIHNPMMDDEGRVWYTATLRPPANQPSWCKDGAANKFAQYFPLARAGRNVSVYDPKTQKFTMVDTCFGSHHLQFGHDGNNTLYLGSPNGAVFGWLNTREFLRTSNGQAAQGWCPTVVDTNGDGKITKPWNEPMVQRGTGGDEDAGFEVDWPDFDPRRDTRVIIGAYGIIVNPADGSIWGAQETHPGKIVRLTLGSNPPETCSAEVFEVPSERWGVNPGGERGSMPRGIDIDRNGVIWTALSASGHLASFDRRQCGVTSGAAAHKGQHCKEGWTLNPLPAPTFRNTRFRADYFYYNWVDQFNTLGLGANVPIATGTGSDSLIAFLPGTREAITLRVPYPLAGFHPRGLDGRIDDPNAGWKGRAVYSSTGADTIWHSEDGFALENRQYKSISKPILVKFQVRPDPLAN